MKTYHTPSPWNVSRHATPEHTRQYGIYAGDSQSDHVIVRGENASADAALIAAAPELLEALKACEAVLANLRRNNRWDVHPEDFNDDVDEAVDAQEQARRVIAKALVGIPTTKDTE